MKVFLFFLLFIEFFLNFEEKGLLFFLSNIRNLFFDKHLKLVSKLFGNCASCGGLFLLDYTKNVLNFFIETTGKNL